MNSFEARPARARWSAQGRAASCVRSLAVGITVIGVVACGKKGPPLPPLVRLPAAPTELKAERRGATVDLQMVIPAQNTDGSRPANVQHVEVYAWNGPPDASAADVMRRGTRVGSLEVKAPRDPNQAVRADDPLGDAEPLEGPGLDQGATAHLRDVLTDTTEADRVAFGRENIEQSADAARSTIRSYVGVAITTRGRRGPTSSPSVVPLGPAPSAPREAALDYDETGVTVRWTLASDASGPAGQPDKPETPAAPQLAYHVYDVSPPSKPTASAKAAGDVRLTTTAVAGTSFVDRRVAWDLERCFAVRTVRTVDGLSVEGDATARTCVTPVDTFAPAPPSGLTAVASGGAISLIWNPSAEPDLAGYRVLRGEGAPAELTPLTSSPIVETTYTDDVAGGRPYVYAVQAVDKAGNASRPSNTVEETAREVR